MSPPQVGTLPCYCPSPFLGRPEPRPLCLGCATEHGYRIPPQIPSLGGQTPPHAPKSDLPEQGGGGGQAGSSPLAPARGASEERTFPG